jgi:hypothetical protein
MIEIAVEFLSPGIYFAPWHFAAFYGEKFLAMRFDSDGNTSFAQSCFAGE